MLNLAIGIVVLIVILMLIGASYEFISAQNTKRKYNTPPGEMVDIGDLKLHVNSMGERRDNQPVVILEASAGANSLDWQEVQPLIAEHAQVISYDRAGNGWSERASTRRTSDNLADELHQLLQKMDVELPVVLAGHRYGGMYIRKYAEKYPDNVAGLILVDSSHPEVFDEDNSAEITRLQRQQRFFQPVGLVRYASRRNPRVNELAESKRAEYFAMMMRSNSNLFAEAKPILEDGITLPDSVDVPLMVISRGEDADLQREREWAERQRDLVALSDTAKHIITETTKSWIVFAEPQTVADSIVEFLEDLTDA